MPEVIEVKLISESLQRVLKNKFWKKIELPECPNCKNGGALYRNMAQTVSQFNLELPLRVQKVNHKGKFLWIEFEEKSNKKWFVGVTFGLAGTFNQNPSRHSHINIQFSKDDGVDITGIAEERIYWDDYKSMGKWKFIDSEVEFKKELDKLGLDIFSLSLSPNPIDSVPLSLFKKHTGKNIGKLLLDQKIICGIGNYIKNEVLYGARISPFSKVKDLSDEQIKLLWVYTLDFLQKLYLVRKKSLGEDFFVYDGILKEIKKDKPFADVLNIYNKKYDPNNKVIEKLPANKSPDGRIVYWVPEMFEGVPRNV